MLRSGPVEAVEAWKRLANMHVRSPVKVNIAGGPRYRTLYEVIISRGM